MVIVRSLKPLSSLSVLSPPVAFDGSKESPIKLLTYPDYPFRFTNQKVTKRLSPEQHLFDSEWSLKLDSPHCASNAGSKMFFERNIVRCQMARCSSIIIITTSGTSIFLSRYTYNWISEPKLLNVFFKNLIILLMILNTLATKPRITLLKWSSLEIR